MHFERLSHGSFCSHGAGWPTGGRAFALAFWLLSLLICTVLLTTATPSFAAAPTTRLALVIGNSQYKHKNAADLPNAAGDAEAITAKLKELGFEVDTGIDVDFDTFENMLYEFRDKIKATGAEDVVFYYAGHGFQLDGRNHLVPTDARLTAREKIGYETVQLNRLIKQINADPRKQRTIVFLDACRDNPLPESVRGDDYENGLADVQMGKDGDNVLVIFSTRPGEVSQDGKDGNSPFAKSLLRHIANPNETVIDMMAEVSNDVYEATQSRQTPRVSGILRSKFYFNLKSSIVATLEPADEPASKPPSTGGSETSRALPASPSVELRSPDDAEPAAPVTEPPPSPEITSNPPPPPAPVEPTPPAAETPSQANEIAAKSPDLPATDAPLSSTLIQNAETAPEVAKPEPSVDAAAVTQQSQADHLAAVASQPATSPLPEGTKIASLDAGETAQPSAPPSGQAIDRAPDRGIAVIRPSAANPASGVPVDGKTLKIVQRPSDGQPLRPSSEEFEVAMLPPPTEDAEPEKQDQPSLAQRVQEALSSIGCFAGNTNGEWGQDSGAALARYLKAKDSSDPAVGPTEEVLAALEQETRQVCEPEPEQAPDVEKTVRDKKTPQRIITEPRQPKQPRQLRQPPKTVTQPRPAKPPRIVTQPKPPKPPKLVTKPRPPKAPPKVASQQPKKPKAPPPPAKVVIPRIGGTSF